MASDKLLHVYICRLRIETSLTAITQILNTKISSSNKNSWARCWNEGWSQLAAFLWYSSSLNWHTDFSFSWSLGKNIKYIIRKEPELQAFRSIETGRPNTEEAPVKLHFPHRILKAWTELTNLYSGKKLQWSSSFHCLAQCCRHFCLSSQLLTRLLHQRAGQGTNNVPTHPIPLPLPKRNRSGFPRTL